MAILEKIIFNNFSVGGECNLFHHGIVQDCLFRNNFEFYMGELYGIIGEFGTGGAALSCGITGNTNFYEGEINVDNKESSISYIIQNSWYVGLDLNESKSIFRKKQTIRQQLEYGISNFNQQLDFNTIVDRFEISNERIDRSIDFVSGERWKASAAIGYANGKKIFCYPWLNSRDVKNLREQLSKTIKNLLDAGCIVIFPTTKEENIKILYSQYRLKVL